MQESWWHKLLQSLSTLVRGSRPEPVPVERLPSNLDAEVLQGLVEMIFSTDPDELSCEECFDRVDRFAELELAGKDAAAAMPLVNDHLKRCKCCREEFAALLEALEAIS